MPPLFVGQQFSSLQAFKDALRAWAIEQKFTPAIRDSDAHRVRVGCRSSPDCPFRVRANFKDGVAKVTTCNVAHGCTSERSSSVGIKRAEISKVKFLIEVVPQLMTVDQNTSTQAIIDVVQAKYGQEIALRQAQKVKKALCPKECRRCDGGMHKGSCSGGAEIVADHSTTSTHGIVSVDTQDSDLQTGFQDETVDLPEDFDVHEEHDIGSQSLTTTLPAVQASLVVAGGLVSTGNAYNYGHSPLVSNMEPGPQGGYMSQTNSEAYGSIPCATQAVYKDHRLVTEASRNAQETRMEAARLMQSAARLMQEAARLNAEAARLTASVANI